MLPDVPDSPEGVALALTLLIQENPDDKDALLSLYEQCLTVVIGPDLMRARITNSTQH